MKDLMLFPAIALAALTSLTSLIGTPAIAEDFTVATFNAEFLYPSKVHIKFGLPFNMSGADAATQAQWDQPGFRDAKYQEAVEAVAPTIAGLGADVVVLTEVGKASDVSQLVIEISNQGVSYNHVEVCACTDPTGQKVAILSKFPLTDPMPSLPGREVFALEEDDPDEEDDTGVSKGMRVTVQVPDGAGAIPIHVYGVHLASERKGHETDMQRVAQASIVRRHFVPLLETREHVIVAGDLNDRRGQPTLKRIRGLADIWPDLIQTGKFQFFGEGEEASRWTYEFRGELNQIDHILVSFSLRKSGSSIHKRVAEIPEQENPSISDHRPLVVSFEIP